MQLFGSALRTIEIKKFRFFLYSKKGNAATSVGVWKRENWNITNNQGCLSKANFLRGGGGGGTCDLGKFWKISLCRTPFSESWAYFSCILLTAKELSIDLFSSMSDGVFLFFVFVVFVVFDFWDFFCWAGGERVYGLLRRSWFVVLRSW